MGFGLSAWNSNDVFFDFVVKTSCSCSTQEKKATHKKNRILGAWNTFVFLWRATLEITRRLWASHPLLGCFWLHHRQLVSHWLYAWKVSSRLVKAEFGWTLTSAAYCLLWQRAYFHSIKLFYCIFLKFLFETRLVSCFLCLRRRKTNRKSKQNTRKQKQRQRKKKQNRELK